MDFDCFASMLVAGKLFPGYGMLMPGKLQSEVEAFYSLHKDYFSMLRPSQIPEGSVEELVLVDCNSWKRIYPFNPTQLSPQAKIKVYDHHQQEESPIPGAEYHFSPSGAAVTELVMLADQEGLSFSSFEATVVLLGLYSDTGSMSYQSTTPEDLRAAALMLEADGNLSIVREYIEAGYDGRLDLIFNELMQVAEIHLIKGLRIVLAAIAVQSYVEGLAQLTVRLAQVHNADAAIVVAEMENKVFLIFRSKSDQVDVASLALHFGGGGHKGAASATLKNVHAEAIKAMVLDKLEMLVLPSLLVRDVMSSPVRSISPATPLATASGIIMRFGHTGLPVVDGEKLVGVVSRRDIDKAVAHGFAHAPVSGYMSRKLLTIAADATVTDARKLMIEHDIGRLPVLEKGKLIGIITRTDIIRLLHGRDVGGNMENRYLPLTNEISIPEKLQQALSPEHYHIVSQMGELADQQKLRIYAVGGIVRDIILGSDNTDLDFVVTGEGIDFAARFAHIIGATCQHYGNFGTATISLADGSTLDIASARREYYAYPAALPEVERGSLAEDLVRRDFSINAMAISLNKDSFGLLIDPFQGWNDIRKKQVRILHNLSFVDDPTRIIRGLRFCQRFSFALESETERFLLKALEEGLLSQISDERLRVEMQLLLSESFPFELLKKYRVLNSIIPGWHVFNGYQRMGELLSPEVAPMRKGQLWIARLLWMTIGQSPKVIAELGERLKLTRHARLMVSNFNSWLATCEKDFIVYDGTSQSELFHLLKSLDYEALWTVYAVSDATHRHYIDHFEKVLRHIKPFNDGKSLVRAGIAPGPHYSGIFNCLRDLQLDGIITTLEEENAYIEEHYAQLMKGGK